MSGGDPMTEVGRATLYPKAQAIPKWFTAWDALDYLRAGRRVAKKGWKSSYVTLIDGDIIEAGHVSREELFEDMDKPHWRLAK